MISIFLWLKTPKYQSGKTEDMRKRAQRQAKSVSVSDVMKNNTSRVMKKLEMQTPMLVQMYSNYYKSYLHYLDDIFGLGYIAEKEIFEKLGINQRAVKSFERISDDYTSVLESQIEIMNNIQKSQLEASYKMIKAFDYYAHYMLESFEKYLSYYNTSK